VGNVVHLVVTQETQTRHCNKTPPLQSGYQTLQDVRDRKWKCLGQVHKGEQKQEVRKKKKKTPQGDQGGSERSGAQDSADRAGFQGGASGTGAHQDGAGGTGAHHIGAEDHHIRARLDRQV